MRDAAQTTPMTDPVTPRKVWRLPILSELPKLTSLTLASVIGGGGGTGGGGSTVFGVILAIGIALGVAGCLGDAASSPSPEMPAPLTLAPISCRVTVADATMDCTGPSAAAGREIIGNQGEVVLLRSSNVGYAFPPGFFTTDVTVQNLSAQPIGTELGNDNDSVYVYFPGAPVVTGGSGTVSIIGATSTFTAPGQSFYAYTGPLLSGETSAAVTWTFLVPNTVTTFTFEVLVAASVPSQGSVLRWNVVDSAHAPWIRGVAAFGPTDALVVNNGVDFPRLTVDGWGRIANPFPDGLVDVSSTNAAGSYIAVGNTTGGDAFVAWYRNNGWQILHTESGDGYIFSSVYADDENHVIAVGYDDGAPPETGVIVWKWGVGDTWHVNTFAGTGQIKWVDGDVANDFAIAQSVNNYLFHFDGASWVDNPTYVTGAEEGGGVAVFAGTAGHYAFGYTDNSSGQQAIVRTWNGSSPDVRYGPFDRKVAALTRDGAGGVYLMEVDGFGIDPVQIRQAANASVNLTGGWAINQLSMVGAEADGNGDLFVRDTTGLYRSDAVGLTSAVTSAYTPEDYTALFAISDNVYLGTVGGFLRGRVGGVWQAPEDLGDGEVRDIWGTNICDLYVVTSNGGIHHSDCPGWDPEFTGASGLRSIFGVGGTVVATGNTQLLVKTGGTWNVHTGGDVATGGTWWDVWGTSSTNIYAVGDNYHIAHWDGAAWTRVVLPFVSPSDSVTISWKGISGSGANDIWVVGTGGHAFHYNGTNWISRDVTGGPSFEHVVSVANGDAMVSADNAIWVAVPARLTRASDTRVIGNRGLARGAGSKIYALGPSQLFLGTR